MRSLRVLEEAFGTNKGVLRLIGAHFRTLWEALLDLFWHHFSDLVFGFVLGRNLVSFRSVLVLGCPRKVVKIIEMVVKFHGCRRVASTLLRDSF